MTKKIHWIVAAIFIAGQLSINANACETDTSKRLILVQGHVLNAYFGGLYHEIKRATTFYGYGWLDEHRVFVAYQKQDTTEAVAQLEIIDLRQSKVTKLTSLGGAGESHFDVNVTTGEVIYNDSDGVKLLSIDAKTNTYKIKDVKKRDASTYNVDCFGAFWVDNKTVGCSIFKNGKSNFVKFPIVR